MSRRRTTSCVGVCIMTICLAAAPVCHAVAEKPEPGFRPVKVPRIEVCFVLDTTGSMSGLIKGAKQKIWSIANDMAGAKPTPRIRFGLIGYRGQPPIRSPICIEDDQMLRTPER